MTNFNVITNNKNKVLGDYIYADGFRIKLNYYTEGYIQTTYLSKQYPTHTPFLFIVYLLSIYRR